MLSNLFLVFSMYNNIRCCIKLSISRISWPRDCNNCSGKHSVYIRRWGYLNRERVHRPYQGHSLLANSLRVNRIPWQRRKVYSNFLSGNPQLLLEYFRI
jgi:hypothetical protein